MWSAVIINLHITHHIWGAIAPVSHLYCFICVSTNHMRQSITERLGAIGPPNHYSKSIFFNTIDWKIALTNKLKLCIFNNVALSQELRGTSTFLYLICYSPRYWWLDSSIRQTGAASPSLSSQSRCMPRANLFEISEVCFISN